MTENKKKNQYTSVRIKKTTRDRLRFIADSLNQTQVAFLDELVSEVFQLFRTFSPSNRDASLMYSNHGQKLILNSNARKVYVQSGVIPNCPINLSIEEQDKLVKERLEG